MSWIDDLRNGDAVQIVETIGLQRKRQNSISPCPACNATQRGSSDRRGPIGLRPDGKGFKCFSCNVTGDNVDLFCYKFAGKSCSSMTIEEMKAAQSHAIGLGLVDTSPSKSVGYRDKNRPKILGPSKKKKYVDPISAGGSVFAWKDDLIEKSHANIDIEQGADVLAFVMNERKISRAAVDEFKLGALFKYAPDGRILQKFLVIPVFNGKGEAVNARFRSIGMQCGYCKGAGCKRCKNGTEKKIYLRCPDRPTCLFGEHRLIPSKLKKPVVIVEGELDVIALWDYGFTENTISGTAGAQHWKEEWLDILEPYSQFVIAYDNDKVGDDGAKTVAERLGLHRCTRARFPGKDVGECLEKGVPQEKIIECVKGGETLLDTSLLKVDDYIGQIEELVMNPDKLRGRATGSLKLDKAIGGWRDGLVILTGGTGAGKTTFSTWLALNQALLGHGVLVTCFEQRPIGTVQKLLRQQVGGDFTNNTPEERFQAMTRLGQLPLWIVDHYGKMSFSEMKDMIRYSVRRKDVKFAIIDHLGFVIDSLAKDERREIEIVVRELATLAINDGVTIVLICHPNRMWIGQQRRVQITDLKGASAIEQDAHIGLVVEPKLPDEENTNPRSIIHVDKCRSEFGLMNSSVSIAFDPNACLYADTWEELPTSGD
jgi:hypothetical protein